MKNSIGAVVLVGLLAIAAGSRAAPYSPDWLPVDGHAWAMLMEDPEEHLARAQEDLSRNDAKGAAAEIRMADTFLEIQRSRLAVASEQLRRLAKDIESHRVVSANQVEVTSKRAIGILDHSQAFTPVMAGADKLYVKEADYHLARAKSLFSQNDNKTAAVDIRKAEAFLKIKAVHAEGKVRDELLSSAAKLEELAERMEAGSVAGTVYLDQGFDRAGKAVRLSL